MCCTPTPRSCYPQQGFTAPEKAPAQALKRHAGGGEEFPCPSLNLSLFSEPFRTHRVTLSSTRGSRAPTPTFRFLAQAVDTLLNARKAGTELVAAGYTMYSSSTVLVLTVLNGVYGERSSWFSKRKRAFLRSDAALSL